MIIEKCQDQSIYWSSRELTLLFLAQCWPISSSHSKIIIDFYGLNSVALREVTCAELCVREMSGNSIFRPTDETKVVWQWPPNWNLERVSLWHLLVFKRIRSAGCIITRLQPVQAPLTRKMFKVNGYNFIHFRVKF